MKHLDEVLALLHHQIGVVEEVREIEETAEKVSKKWVSPTTGGQEETNGLIYGLVQSGKTGVLTVTGAIGADEGYRTLIIFTSDNDALYEQTLGRAREAFPAMDVMGKGDYKDSEAFLQRVKNNTCVLVTTKNSGILKTLIENFKKGNLRNLSCLLIDDEADQASLNTKASKDDGQRSAINERILELRGFFQKNTYLQVTATPQSLFLQDPEHEFRPKFTVLSHPGAEYVGGNDFFAEGSSLIREFPLGDLSTISPGPQPNPALHFPKSLLRALDIFMIGATFKRVCNSNQNSAFLCHVSTLKADHNHIVRLLREYKTALPKGLRQSNPVILKRLRDAYDDLSRTHEELRRFSFEEIVEKIEFLSPGIHVKLVNGETDEDVALHSPYNLFVGGNKLGRGVTIKNLLVSYYGRNPKRPQADTVLQHARMYGYRRKDIGLLRLFLPPELHAVFRAINQMEQSLRDLISNNPSEEFRGIYVKSGLSPTRKNVLVPGAVGVYTGGSIYNPAQVLRTAEAKDSTRELDALLADVADNTFIELPIREIKRLVQHTCPDQDHSEHVWNQVAVAESIGQFAELHKHRTGYVYVDRGRGLQKPRRETQGILDGGESARVPSDKVTLFMLRTESQDGASPAWWPQIRFPKGRYAFAFAV
ncbi:MAG TPA: Z1 domain-containing protein [Luteimonas sp.]|nr:Z1 domain-containing protein [Luteimonas sp.]